MGNYSRWDDLKATRAQVRPTRRAEIEQDLQLGQLIYDLRVAAGTSGPVIAGGILRIPGY